MICKFSFCSQKGSICGLISYDQSEIIIVNQGV